MSDSSQLLAGAESLQQSSITWQEIVQQPDLWPTTVARVRAALEKQDLLSDMTRCRVLTTGAGSSAYAASSVALAWPDALMVPTTDLLVDAERYLTGVRAVVSLARSGNSPESAAVVDRVRALRPDVLQIAITCNEDNSLARCGLDSLIVLDPRANDRSLVMTGSFSNLVLAGLALASPDAAGQQAIKASEAARKLIPTLDAQCRKLASGINDRIVVLSSSPSLGWGREAGLKILEMTAGQFPVVTETFLGLRHGPMSFLRSDTLVLALLSSDVVRRRYEVDLLQELRSKGLGHIAVIGQPTQEEGPWDEVIPAILPNAPDDLRTPFEIVTAQILGHHLSVRMGLNPDNPSPDGVINRVVQGVTIHSA